MSTEETIVVAAHRPDVDLIEALRRRFEREGHELVVCEAWCRDDVDSAVAAIAETRIIRALVHVGEPPERWSILDRAGFEAFRSRLDREAGGAVWWLRAVGRHMIEKGVHGSVTMLHHVASVMPSPKFGAFAAPQAFAAQAARCAAIEFDRHGIRVNVVLRGWLDRGGDEKDYFEALAKVHAGDATPLLHFVSEAEVADACADMALGNPSSTGATLAVDRGYTLNRTLRQLASFM